MRSAVIALVVQGLGTPAYAYLPCDDVPEEHWAAPALEFLIERGYLELGFNSFMGRRPVTHYEFEQGMLRLIEELAERGYIDDAATVSEAFKAELVEIEELQYSQGAT